LHGGAQNEKKHKDDFFGNFDYRINCLILIDGMAYDIAENEEGSEIMEMVGQKIAVKGTVMEAEGTKIITVTEFKLLDE